MRAHPAYWLMLALAVGSSGGMRALAVRAKAHDRQFVIHAIYRFPADSRPECEDLAGRPPAALCEAGRWSRIVLPDTRKLSTRGCLLHGALPM